MIAIIGIGLVLTALCMGGWFIGFNIYLFWKWQKDLTVSEPPALLWKGKGEKKESIDGQREIKNHARHVFERDL